MSATGSSRREDTYSPQGLYFLFEPGARPGRSQLLEVIEAIEFASVSHDPASSPAEPDDPALGREGFAGQWLEVMTSGLTFDLLGMAPEPGVSVPSVAHHMALDTHCNPSEKEAMALVPGPHLADACNSLPVVRAMLDLGCRIARSLPAVEALCWSPARTAMATEMLCRSVADWTSGGPFPALGLTAFAPGEDGMLSSEGLHFFVGQELRFHPALAEDRLSATRLGLRLVHDIVGTGRVDEAWEFLSDEGKRYSLTPVSDGRLVEVARI